MIPRPEFYSLVDVLAERLSEKTGTKFTVCRVRLQEVTPLDRFRGTKGRRVTRYVLRAERADCPFAHVFHSQKPLHLNDMKRWLASISDMLSMGFIRTPEHFPGVYYEPTQPRLLPPVTPPEIRPTQADLVAETGHTSFPEENP